VKFKEKDVDLYPLVALSGDNSLTEKRFSSFCGSKLVSCIILSSTFPPTGLTPRTPAVFRFSRACWF